MHSPNRQSTKLRPSGGKSCFNNACEKEQLPSASASEDDSVAVDVKAGELQVISSGPASPSMTLPSWLQNVVPGRQVHAKFSHVQVEELDVLE